MYLRIKNCIHLTNLISSSNSHSLRVTLNKSFDLNTLISDPSRVKKPAGNCWIQIRKPVQYCQTGTNQLILNCIRYLSISFRLQFRFHATKKNKIRSVIKFKKSDLILFRVIFSFCTTYNVFNHSFILHTRDFFNKMILTFTRSARAEQTKTCLLFQSYI